MIRGGTSSVGLAAAAIASRRGAHVIATTRRPDREKLLRDHGAHEVIIDGGEIADTIEQRWRGGVDRVLELVGTTTLVDSLRCVRPGGAVCMTGMVGGAWSLPDFAPMDAIPSAVNLTAYHGDVEQFLAMPFDDLAQQVRSGELPVSIAKVFPLDRIADAHRMMEENAAGGKIVVIP